MSTVYYLTSSDLLVSDAPGSGTQDATTGVGETLDQVYTHADAPSDTGITGDYAAALVLSVASADQNISVAWARVSSGGSVQATSSFTSEQESAVGTLDFSASSVDLGTWASGDRLRLIVRTRDLRTMGGGTRTTTYDFGSSGSTTTAPWDTVGPPGEGTVEFAGVGSLTVVGATDKSGSVEFQGEGEFVAVGSAPVIPVPEGTATLQGVGSLVMVGSTPELAVPTGTVEFGSDGSLVMVGSTPADPVPGGTVTFAAFGSVTWVGSGGPSFTPPTYIVRPRVDPELPSLWRKGPGIPTAYTVLIEDGIASPPLASVPSSRLAAADRVFTGGRRYEITGDEADILVAAGYEVGG